MMTSDTSKRSYYENDMQVQEIFFVLMCDTEANFDFGLKLSPLSNLAIKRSQHHLARSSPRWQNVIKTFPSTQPSGYFLL
ncbi:hypothetical protein RRG08_053048 [Elysia crispata]|uniref:Uncharacterized protein n=1 Tax=Elysia crispata TaxID=231223 RepID=A0AAE1CLB5_9GAST|nr:hypothetical protein RRG08_053048 [Elysia crispata]